MSLNRFLLWSLALLAGSVAVAFAPRLCGQEANPPPTLQEEFRRAQQLADAKQFTQATPHYRRVVELANERAALSVEEYYLVGVAHLYLMADAFDHSLQGGKLDERRAQVAQKYRDHIWKGRAESAAQSR
jgi:hypothetical protein